MASQQKELGAKRSDPIESITTYQHNNVSNDKAKNWNRAIPEAGYITLGTIRYGVRLSAASLEYRPGFIATNSDRLSVNSINRCESSDCSVNTYNKKNKNKLSKDSCCCSGSSGIVAPCWKTENNKKTQAKNRPQTSLLSSTCCKIQSCDRNENIQLPPIVKVESVPATQLTSKLNILQPKSVAKLKKRKFDHKKIQIKMSTGSTSSSSSTELSPNKKPSIINTPHTATTHISRSSSTPPQPSSSSSSLAAGTSLSTSSTSFVPLKISTQTPLNTNSISGNVDNTVSSSFGSSYCEDNNSIGEYIRQWPTKSNTSHSESVLFELCSREITESPTLSTSLASSKLNSHNNYRNSSKLQSSSPISQEISYYKLSDTKNNKSQSISKSSSFRNTNSNHHYNQFNRNPRLILDDNNFNYENNLSRNFRNRVASSSSIPTTTTKLSPTYSYSKLNSPPLVPPKPKPQPPIHPTDNSIRYNNNDDHLQSTAYDPLNFHRKIQNFEKQNSINESSKNISVGRSVENDQQENENRCEFFGCFPTNKNINSAQRNCCAPAANNSDNDRVIEFNINQYQSQNKNQFFNNNSNSELNKPIELQNSLSSPSIVEKSKNCANSLTDKRKLHYDSNGRLKNLTDLTENNNSSDHYNSSISDFRSKEFLEPIIRSPNAISTSSVVIRKLTPKLSRKLNCFTDQSPIRSEICDEPLIQNNHNTNSTTDTTIARVHHNPSSAFVQHYPFNENDSEIEFIDSSGSGDGENLFRCSHSDIDLTNVDLLLSNNKNTQIISKYFSDTTNNNNNNNNNNNKNKNCNLSFDSVPKYSCENSDYNITNYSNNNNNNNSQSLCVKDVYNSLSDVETSTISCLSEESINCFCPNVHELATISNENLISHLCKIHSENENQNENQNQNDNVGNDFCYCDLKLNQTEHQLKHNEDVTNLNSLSPQSISPLGVRGPLIKRVPAIESFGLTQIYGREHFDKEIMMDRRFNTLERLGIGRRSTPSPSNQDKSKKTLEKSERLKELTERLRGTRSSPTPPPVAPPRKPRHGLHSQSNSTEKVDKSTDSLNYNSLLSSNAEGDIIHMDEDEELTMMPPSISQSKKCKEMVVRDPIITQQISATVYHQLKPNTSLSNLESLLSKVEPQDYSKSPPPFNKIDEVETHKKTPTLRRENSMESPVVNRTSLTLPRCYDDIGDMDNKQQDNLTLSPNPESDFINNPLKKTELSINLLYNNEKEKVPLSPDVIMEEQELHLEDEKNEELSSKIVETNSNTSSKHSSDIDELDESKLPSTLVNEKSIPQFESSHASKPSDPILVNNSSEMYDSKLGTLMEEEIPMESPPETFLQTATTCLIPVPVYECTAHEWSNENPPQQWVDVASDEIGPISEIVDSIAKTDKMQENIGNNLNNEKLQVTSQISQDSVPIISVSHHNNNNQIINSLDERKSTQEFQTENISLVATENSSNNTERPEVNVEKSLDDEKLEKEGSIDYSEVKKRYSNDDCEPGERVTSNDFQRGSSLEEKSKRRKGRYFEGTDWVQTAREVAEQENQKVLALDMSIDSFSDLKSKRSSDFLILNTPVTDDCRTPCSLNSMDPNTPESEYCNKQPIWPKGNRRTSLSAQSSEEKDDYVQLSGQLPKSGQHLLFPRTDSVSDNESDKTPSSRDRTSPSPAPSDQDFKRYSKRPLRGPYGQMLEAEMKKPNKKHFEEILDELKDPESISTRRNRVNDNRSFDDSVRHSPQYSSSMRVRKSNTYLPIPSHTRAASTPSQMENLNTLVGLEKINPLQKRYQSSLDNSTTSIDDKDFKQFSLDGTDRLENLPKRTLSEVKHYPKRSVSNVGEKQQKRSLEEISLTHSSRTPSERSILIDPIGSRGGSGHGVSGGSSSMSETTGSNLLATPELLAALLKGSSEKLISEQRQKMFQDTRTHVVQEIYRNEQSYVESLQTVVVKYFKVLKTPEHAGMIDSRTVDEIFFMVPEILEIHQKFLCELKFRLDSWAPEQKVGDAFIETFSKTEVLETYTSFVNNCNRAKDAIRTTKQARPSFARFLETTAREHKGKLSLDNLLIKPVQKFPNYEMLFTRLIKHTDTDHPDQKHLKEVLKLVHDTLVHINCKEREILENGLREATLRELEGVIEGITELVAADRQFLLFDLVSMPSGQGARKERGFFLFNDLLVITSIKRRSGTIRKPNATTCPGSVASTLDTNKYKFLTKVSLDNLEIVKTKDENVRRIMNEIEQLADDCNKLQQIAEISATVRYPHQSLEESIRELHRDIQRQLSERQSNDAQLNMLELTANSPGGSQPLTVVFNKAEKRSQWEESFNEAKQKLAASLERHPIPEFMTSIPIRKTRAGLQFTCAAPTLSEQKDVWVCNSDGYVGQVCVMSLSPEPNVTSCNGVCNARILCVASVPAYSSCEKVEERPASDIEIVQEFRKSTSPNCHSISKQGEKKKSSSGSDIQLDSNSSSDDSEVEGNAGRRERMPSPAPASMTSTANKATSHHVHQDSNSDENDGNQSTMWLGTEDGCIHVYNCTDNIRIKKNKIKIQHVSAVFSILYLDNRVFVSLANGDICVYLRDSVGWNTNGPLCISVGTVSSPVNKLLSVHGKLWCSIQGIIKVLDTKTLQVECQIQISSDSKPITNMAVSSNYVWLSIQNSAHIKCFHSNNHELLFEVNLAPCVNKMLSNCDDIIRQHKAACLRVTSLLSCKDLIWVGTSAGVLLTIPAQGYGKGTLNMPVVTGIPHGHTGHVRFLTFVETGTGSHPTTLATGNANPSAPADSHDSKNKRSSTHTSTKSETSNILIISGGDGYEDFRNSGANSLSEIAGREDSTNHLLIWQI